MASESGKLFPFHNSGLFSEYYLSNILKEQEDWKADVSKLFLKLKDVYDSQKKELPLLNENSLEDNFIRPILKELGYVLEPQPSLPPAMEQRSPIWLFSLTRLPEKPLSHTKERKSFSN
jgi:hypothetical protein